ncbi:MAG: hypothetical protein AB1486_28840 [Planctomycetota bacterium]
MIGSIATREESPRAGTGIVASFFGLLAGMFVVLVSTNVASAQGAPTEWRSLTDPSGYSNERFTRGVAIENELLVVGIDGDDGGKGSVYVYRQVDRDWELEQKLTADERVAGDAFGKSVALSGSWILVGAPGKDGSGADCGAVYFFENDGTSWVQRCCFWGDAANDKLGASRGVALAGDVAVAGSAFGGDPGMESGYAYVYQRTDLLGWQSVHKLTASDGNEGDHFGCSVDINSDRVAIGANQGDSMNQDAGCAYVYGLFGDWHEWKVTASDGQAGDNFGDAIALEGDRLLVGADKSHAWGTYSGAAYYFLFDGADWSQQQIPPGHDTGAEDSFGSAVALCGGTALIGAEGEYEARGAAYLFRMCGDWTQDLKLVPSDRQQGSYFGYSLDLDEEFAVVGATWWDGYYDSQGKAYLYPTPEITLIAEPNPVVAGNDLTLQCLYGWQGHQVGLAVVEVDGFPCFTFFLLTYFNPSNWRYVVTATTPPWLAGHSVTFQAFKLSLCGGGVTSNEEEVVFQ